mgnify:CR=1 FL=1
MSMAAIRWISGPVLRATVRGPTAPDVGTAIVCQLVPPSSVHLTEMPAPVVYTVTIRFGSSGSAMVIGAWPAPRDVLTVSGMTGDGR